MRIIHYIVVFLTLGLLICFFCINYLYKDNKRLRAEKNGLKIELNRREEVEKNVREREKVVEKLVYKDKAVFDWTSDISNTAVVDELQVNCKSCSNSKH